MADYKAAPNSEGCPPANPKGSGNTAVDPGAPGIHGGDASNMVRVQ